MAAIMDFVKRPYLRCLDSYGAEIQNLHYLPPNLYTGTYFNAMVAILDFFSSYDSSEGITIIIGLLSLTAGARRRGALEP